MQVRNAHRGLPSPIKASLGWRAPSKCVSRSGSSDRTRFAKKRSPRPTCCAASSSEQVQLLQPTAEGLTVRQGPRKLLVYFPGTDGTGNAIAPQLPGLLDAGFDVRSLFVDIRDRSSWEELTARAVRLIKELLASHPQESQVTLLAESFGGCLALRCAAFAPELFERMVLVNPATGFASSYGGLLNLVASTNLLSVFPEQLYQVAQAVLLPFLVDKENVGDVGLEAVRQMIIMQPPETRQVGELAARQGPTAESRRSLLELFESYAPAAAVSWRLKLLGSGNLSDEILGGIRVPALLICSAKDRLLGSLQEGARLERAMQNAMRLVLPKSGHTALLEDDVSLTDILRRTRFLPPELLAASSDSLAKSRGGHRSSTAGLSSGKALPIDRHLVIANASASREMATPLAPLKDRSAPSALSTASGGAAFAAAVAPPQQSSRALQSLDTLDAQADSKEIVRPDPVAQERVTLRQQKAATWSRPDPAFDRLTSIYNPFREVVSPVVRGLEHLPSAADTKRPLLFVGNHARLGLYDLPFLVIELYLRRIKVRGLAHPGHWKGPLGGIFQSFGAVKASPMAAFKLLKAGEALLLFPGGGREVNKRKGEDYQLFWSEEPDFVRLAAKMDALIIPFASVGGDEAFNVALDSDEILRAPILGDLTRAAFRRVGPELDLSESVPPVTRLPGIGLPSLLPVPNFSRLYFRFMQPVDPAAAEGILTDPTITRKVYSDVKQQVYEGIALLKEEQRRDPKRSLPARLMDQFVRGLPAFDVLR